MALTQVGSQEGRQGGTLFVIGLGEEDEVRGVDD